jgi:hypothetical protein
MLMISPREVAERWPLLTERKQKDLRARRAIPYHRLGHRTIGYRPVEIERFIKQFVADRRIEAIPNGKHR